MSIDPSNGAGAASLLHRVERWAAIVAAACAPMLGSACAETAELVMMGDAKELRPQNGKSASQSRRSSLLIIAIDGASRAQLYDLLREGKLPQLSRLIGGPADDFAHAHFDDRYLASLPSTTTPAWVTAFTGVGSAEHGIAGNEFFIRQERRFAAPVPVAFSNPDVAIKSYTDQYTNHLSLVKSVYERMRDEDSEVIIWVAMHPFHRGADRLLVTDRSVLGKAFTAFLREQVVDRLTDTESAEVYEELDEAVGDTVADSLEDEELPLPDVLTVYFVGLDAFAHVSEKGPDKARRKYLIESLDPIFGDLRKALEKRGGMADRYVVVTSDHGHTEVLDDDEHALGSQDEADPRELIEKAGFRLRPFELEVDDQHDFQAVLAYQGAIAYLYAADRSTCPKKKQACDWKRPPRYEKDVLALADAIYENNRRGHLVRELKGTLDMVLTRRPKPHDEVDEPFQVYDGDRKLVPVGRYLRRHPHPQYVAVEERLRELAVGPAGERAGDILLITNNGNRDRPEERYYFSPGYRSWHGSPSKLDGEIPLIVAHPDRSKATLRNLTRSVLGDEPYQRKLTDLLLKLRKSEPESHRLEPASRKMKPTRSK